MKKLIAQGAEAKVYSEKESITKDRFKKSYRFNLIDNKLRKTRTRGEAKILDKLTKLNFPAPKVIEHDEKKGILKMEKIPGNKLRDELEKIDYIKYSKEIGKLLAILHDNNIIHGDLTTSNMILNKDKLFFIDFGLSYISLRIEDRAVDLHLIRQALESKHYKIWEKCFKAVLAGYKTAKQSKETIKRFDVVESRGRNKAKW